MLFLVVRFVIFSLYLLGIFLLYHDYVNLYFGLSVYLLIFIIHLIHLFKFKKKQPLALSPLFTADVLIFGILPILEKKH